MALTPCEFRIDLRGLWAELLIWECKFSKSWLKFQQNQAFPCIILLLNDRLFFFQLQSSQQNSVSAEILSNCTNKSTTLWRPWSLFERGHLRRWSRIKDLPGIVVEQFYFKSLLLFISFILLFFLSPINIRSLLGAVAFLTSIFLPSFTQKCSSFERMPSLFLSHTSPHLVSSSPLLSSWFHCAGLCLSLSPPSSLQVVSMGLYLGEKAYLRSSWNILDGFLVFVSLIDIVVSMAGGAKILGVLRVLRLLRTLRPLRLGGKNCFLVIFFSFLLNVGNYCNYTYWLLIDWITLRLQPAGISLA